MGVAIYLLKGMLCISSLQAKLLGGREFAQHCSAPSFDTWKKCYFWLRQPIRVKNSADRDVFLCVSAVRKQFVVLKTSQWTKQANNTKISTLKRTLWASKTMLAWLLALHLLLQTLVVEESGNTSIYRPADLSMTF